MFRGEPVAYYSILIGFVFFILTQIFGLLMPGVIIPTIGFNVFATHYILAFLGWIGMVILGAQLQFFRAISGVRKFDPDPLRYLYLLSLPLGVISLILGYIVLERIFIYVGFFLYFVGVAIHSYWVFSRLTVKLFRFPLTYFIAAHLFFLSGLIFTTIQIFDNPYYIGRNFKTIHILGVGWISLSLQGAMIRALPMFVGNVIDRGFRKYIDPHLYFSALASAVLSFGFIIEQNLIIIIGTILWVISWIWVIALLIASIILSDREIIYKITLGFVGPGLLFMILGTYFGINNQFELTTLFHRGLHIHFTLLAGLALIMLGVIQRVNSFQVYTMVNNPKDQDREVDVRLDDFLRIKFVRLLLPGFIISPIIMITGFWIDELLYVAIGGSLNLIFTLLYGYYLFLNLKYYETHKNEIIPFWMKPKEYQEQIEESSEQSN